MGQQRASPIANSSPGQSPDLTLASQVIDVSGTLRGKLLVLNVEGETAFGSLQDSSIYFQYNENGPLNGLPFRRETSETPYGKVVEEVDANVQASNSEAAAITSASLARQEQMTPKKS